MEQTTHYQFQLDHLGETKYTYNHRDETSTKVIVEELQNGGAIRAYHYAEDGTQLDYYSFNIRNLDERKIVAQRFDTKENHFPENVRRAIHSGGWIIENIYKQRIFSEENDPLIVQYLDMRDGFQRRARDTDSPLQGELLSSVANLIEQSLVVELSNQIAEDSGDYWADLKDNKIDKKDFFRAWFMNVVEPQANMSYSKAEEDELIESAEYARNQYYQGENCGDAFDEYYQNLRS